jgi:hypothetical protein
MNLIKGKEKEEKRQPIMEYIKGSPIGWSLTQIVLNLSQNCYQFADVKCLPSEHNL